MTRVLSKQLLLTATCFLPDVPGTARGRLRPAPPPGMTSTHAASRRPIRQSCFCGGWCTTTRVKFFVEAKIGRCLAVSAYWLITYEMAERVGFVPAILAPINHLGLIRSPQSTKSTQSLSIRYKTGTAQSRALYLERRRELEPCEARWPWPVDPAGTHLRLVPEHAPQLRRCHRASRSLDPREVGPPEPHDVGFRSVPLVSGLWGPLSNLEGRKRRVDLAARRRLLTPPGRGRHPVRAPATSSPIGTRTRTISPGSVGVRNVRIPSVLGGGSVQRCAPAPTRDSACSAARTRWAERSST